MIEKLDLPEQQGEDAPKSEKIEHTLSAQQIEALFELEKPIEEILEQLRPKIERGIYSVIIGDDASGRIPTRIIEKALKAIYEKRRFAPPIVRFIAGSTRLHGKDEEIRIAKKKSVKQQMKKIKNTLPQDTWKTKKMLIVTDTIAEGNSISVLINALKEVDIRADVATIGMTNHNMRTVLEKKWKSKIVSGGGHTPAIYAGFNPQVRELSGIIKKDEDLFSKPLKSQIDADWAEDDIFETANQIQTGVNQARDIAFKIADRLTENFGKKSKRSKKI